MKKLKQIGLCFFVLGCFGLSVNAQTIGENNNMTFKEELMNAKKILKDPMVSAEEKANTIVWTEKLIAKCESKLNDPNYSLKAKAKAQKIIDYLTN